MVTLYTHVACRMWSVKSCYGNVLCLHKSSRLLFYTNTPVSYTHLDVYKRQRLASLQRDYDKAFNQLSDGNGSVVRQAEMLKGMSLTRCV